MKKQNIIIGVIAVIVIIIIAVFIGKHGNFSTGGSSAYIAPPTGPNSTATTTTPIPVTVTGTSTDGVTSYVNNELGFSVNYPSSWTIESDPSGPSFTIPLTVAGQSVQNTIATLAASIYTTSGACSFPTLGSSATTKISTTTAGNLSFGTLTVQNTASNLNYNDTMYTLQQGSGSGQYCYVFAFGAVAKSTTSASIESNNASIIDQANKNFAAIVKSFAAVTGPAGQSETSHPTGN